MQSESKYVHRMQIASFDRSLDSSSSPRRMVKFVISPEIQALISEYNALKNLSEDDDGYITSSSPSIEHLQLVHIASMLQTANPTDGSQSSLRTILKSTQLYIEPIEKPKPVGSRYIYVYFRIPNIKLEWKLYDAVSSNENTTPWSPMSVPNQRCTPYSPPTKIIPPPTPK